MSYTIKQVHIVYKEDKIDEIAVLWVSNKELNWVRASYCNTEPSWGYKYLDEEEDQLSEKLFQEVAGQGKNLPDKKKKIYFPKVKNFEQ